MLTDFIIKYKIKFNDQYLHFTLTSSNGVINTTSFNTLPSLFSRWDIYYYLNFTDITKVMTGPQSHGNKQHR